MDAVQKGVQMAKAKAFNDIVKLLNLEMTLGECLDGIEDIIEETFDDIEKIKEKHAPKIPE